MMRMRVILVGLLIAMVLVCGCGQKAQDGGDTTPAQTTGPTGEIPEQTEPGEVETPVIEGISQEDLDALSEDLKAMEFEDLGGLSDT
jgi:hypothetical protein